MKRPILFFLLLAGFNLPAQNSVRSALFQRYGAIWQSSAYMLITTDSRSLSLGDAGTALSPSAHAVFRNAARIGLAAEPSSVSVSWQPWLRSLVPGMSLGALTAHKHIRNAQTLGLGFRYFSIQSAISRQHPPREWDVNLVYAAKLSKEISGSFTFRYLYSDIVNNITTTSVIPEAGKSFMVDVGVFGLHPDTLFDSKINWSWGISANNIGSKISYSPLGEDVFTLPSSLRCGAGISFYSGKKSLTLTADASKVCSDSVGYDMSFSVHNFSAGGGVECGYQEMFFVRAGFHASHDFLLQHPMVPLTGNYFTAGIGVHYKPFTLDLAYVYGLERREPLDGTVSFSLKFDFGKNG